MKTQGSVLERCISKFLILFVFLQTGSPAFAHPLVQYWENRGHAEKGLYFEPRVSVFTTSENFDSNSRTQFLNSASVSRAYFDVNAAYGISPDLTVFGRLSVLSEKITNPLQKDLGAFGLSDQLLGASFQVLNADNGLSARLQFDAVFPAYQNSTALTNGKAYLGDESTDLTFGSFVSFPLHQTSMAVMSAEAGAAYLYRSKGYSAAIPVSIFIQRMPVHAGFLAAIGARGQVSLRTDTTSSSPLGLSLAQQESNRGAAGSALIDGINSSWWAAQASLGYQNNSKTTYRLTAGFPFIGTNAPAGLVVNFGVGFVLGGERTPYTRENPASFQTKPSRKYSQARGFSTYDQDSKITSVNDQLYLVKIDHGASDGVELGQIFDIFQTSNLIARAKVISVKDDEAALNVVEYYQDHTIETGFTARRLVQ